MLAFNRFSIFGIISLLFVVLCECIEPIILVHGGAGVVTASTVTRKIKGVKLAARIGYKTLNRTGNILDAVQESIRAMEIDECFNAGYGSVLTIEGKVENDAAIMNGATLEAGCVSLLENILNPIVVARLVMEKTEHNFMAGNGAIRLAVDAGLQLLPEGALITENAKKALQDYKNSLNMTVSKNRKQQFGEPGTVGAVGIDANGNIAVGTSTGGITGKLSGRIGDSPILGAGTYADNKIGGVSSTGHGEPIMRFNLAQKILQLIQYKNLSAQEATERALNEMKTRLDETGGAIAIDAKGDVGVYFTTNGMPWAYQKGNVLKFGFSPGKNTTETVFNGFRSYFHYYN